ncbi:VOC family protein [Bacillus sonorensis]|uniref:VOC family protein n=1 Tax=Bacillus sonorensis TaxID=119858 RepID=UPI00227E42FA|nr:VOC family protein [Bacillus sonorensis]MCY8088625.1 VOC family protein [Bacillus sonorensis]
MGFRFDHLVHFVNSPLKAIEEYNKLGLYAVEGGKHEYLGTYNSLSYFDLSYIELIGVYDPQLVESAADIKYSLRKTFQNENFVEGLSRIALRSTDLEAEAERFRSLGLEVYGPSPFSRRRPDGSLVSWELLHVGKPGEKLELPFFIEWGEKDDDRKQNLINRSVIAEHPKGNISLSSVAFAIPDFKGAIEKWSNYLNLKTEEPFVDESLNANGQRLKLDGGDIVFYSPIGDGIVSQTLKNRGEKPFLVEFTDSDHEGDFQVMGSIYRFSKK